MQTALRMDSLRQREVDHALAPLRAKFTDDLPGHAEAIDALMLAAESLPDPSHPLKQIQGIVHRLTGVSAILGFPEVGTLAQRSELAIARYVGARGREGRLAEIGAMLDDLVVEMERQAQLGPAPRDA